MSDFGIDNPQKHVEEECEKLEKKADKNCEGPNSAYVKLISSDNYEFIVKRELAVQSKMIKTKLSKPGEDLEGQANTVNLENIPGNILEVVCEYMKFRRRFANSGLTVPEFIFPKGIAMDLFMAACYLDL